MDIYRDNILDHYRHRRNFGKIVGAQTAFEELNPLCGDKVKLFLKIENGRVEEAGFIGEGCAISQAAASMLTEEIKGQSLVDLEKLAKDDILSLLGVDLTPTRLKCALLPLEALRGAMAELKRKKK